MDAPTRLTADPKQVNALPPRVRKALSTELKPALLKDPFHGDRIKQELWPKRFRTLPNLFCFELPDACRGVYAVLTHPGREREVRIVWLGDHEKHDRLLGYSTS